MWSFLQFLDWLSWLVVAFCFGREWERIATSKLRGEHERLKDANAELVIRQTKVGKE